MAVIDNIVRIMAEKGITAYKLEKDININAATFAHWKSGTQPAADKLEKIISYLKVSPNELFGYQPNTSLTENEQELLEQFRRLPEREQIKFIGRIEEAVKNMTSEHRELESSDSKIG